MNHLQDNAHEGNDPNVRRASIRLFSLMLISCIGTMGLCAAFLEHFGFVDSLSYLAALCQFAGLLLLLLFGTQLSVWIAGARYKVLSTALVTSCGVGLGASVILAIYFASLGSFI